MEVKNATLLALVNQRYENNITWNRSPEPKGRRYRFTLRCKSSYKPGHRRTFQGHHHFAACWHVHGDFFDALFTVAPNAVIRIGTGHKITKHSGNWEDRSVGSFDVPRMYSEMCDCTDLDEG